MNGSPPPGLAGSRGRHRCRCSCRATSGRARPHGGRVGLRSPASKAPSISRAAAAGRLTLGTDNGSQFTSRDFRTHLSARGITHRRGGYRDPESQAFIESWFGQFKKRCAWRIEWETIEQARQEIASYRRLPPPAALRAGLPHPRRGRPHLGRPRTPTHHSDLTRQRRRGPRQPLTRWRTTDATRPPPQRPDLLLCPQPLGEGNRTPLTQHCRPARHTRLRSPQTRPVGRHHPTEPPRQRREGQLPGREPFPDPQSRQRPATSRRSDQ